MNDPIEKLFVNLELISQNNAFSIMKNNERFNTMSDVILFGMENL